MHFITFPVASTNIFPLSNSTQGGQLVTEFNLKSRDMVATNPNVKYPIGPSFLHCKDDFKVKLLEDSDVADYSEYQMYNRGDYCRYGDSSLGKDTYICIKDIRSYEDTDPVERSTKFTGDGETLDFYFGNTEIVVDITSVVIDGTTLDDTDYSLDNTSLPAVLHFNTPPVNNAVIQVEYKINLHTDPTNPKYWVQTAISTSILQIGPGRGVINGHYVETLAPMQIDLKLANADLKLNSQEELYGNLSIGIKTYFSEENTMSGAMLVENTDHMYVGVQLVVEKREKFTTPNDCPEESQQGTAIADIKLADFSYINGTISASSITPNPNVTRYIPSDRIYDFSKLLDDKYVSSASVSNRFLYTFSGASKDWCNSTDSLMVWDDVSPTGKIRETEPIPTVGHAQFIRDNSGNVHLVVPHKQLDSILPSEDADPEKYRLYYLDKDIPFPTANYASNASGIVTKEYTQIIKELASKLSTFKEYSNGKMLAYWDVLARDEDGALNHEFPKSLSGPNYNIGDYILVREDYTVAADEDESTAASTMYVILPGYVSGLRYYGQGVENVPNGIKLNSAEVIYEGDNDVPEDVIPWLANDYSRESSYTTDWEGYVVYNGATYKCIEDTPNPAGDFNPALWSLVYDGDADSLLNYSTAIGINNDDYFQINYHSNEEDITPYYFVVSNTRPKGWSEPIILTGGVPLASEVQIGGFYNASTDSSYTDAGYVYLDDTGHLKLVDYELLRAGALAYQLGADFSVPTNQTLEYVQESLDEMVNSRVAFTTKPDLSTTPSMINVYIPLPSDEEGTLNIYNIDSRFDTGVYIHFVTNADDENRSKDYSKIVINISNCEKIRIDSSITTWTSGPLLNIFRSCLYYDATVINYIRSCDINLQRPTLFSNSDFTGFDGLTLWYSRFYQSDPDITVNGMEISQPNVKVPEEIAFWSENITGDNHYTYALRSLTMSNQGRIIGCSLYVSNSSTETDIVDATSKHIILGGDFDLPQGSQLQYPMACLNSALRITGTFTTAYSPVGSTYWVVTETSFTASSSYLDGNDKVPGTIAFNSKVDTVDATYTYNIDDIDGWAPGDYHIFYGGTTT